MPLPSSAKLLDVIAKLQALTGFNQIPELKEALQAKGITLMGNETMADLVNFVNDKNLAMTGDATVSAGDIRSGKYGYKAGTKVNGSLITQATGPQTITPGNSDIVKPAGIYDGAITIKRAPVIVTTMVSPPGIPGYSYADVIVPGMTQVLGAIMLDKGNSPSSPSQGSGAALYGGSISIGLGVQINIMIGNNVRLNNPTAAQIYNNLYNLNCIGSTP
ncbi:MULTISPECIES: hypothetical protein [Paenibacillus]|uniref:hypothetical protein n=1 Tax=Paenibacillus TaxID=44249 RepID=UPI0011A580BE|nr:MULTISPECIES: hypothetical protein [Paenibacillus]MBJ9991461.1 hypothetical protein [Paenibacillus sp. S28]